MSPIPHKKVFMGIKEFYKIAPFWTSARGDIEHLSIILNMFTENNGWLVVRFSEFARY
jgi:hypothetical protein